MKITFLIVFTFITVAGYSQNTINSYKYVLIPEKFGFLSADDEYGLNTTAKSLLEQKGFTVFWSNGNLPQNLAANKCMALMADVTQRKALFTTNLTLELKDCSGNIIFKGKEGRSREKEFYAAYNEALNEAFTSLRNLPYKYDSALVAPPQQLAATPAPATTTATPATATPATTTTATPAPATPAPVSPQGPALYAQVIPNGYQLIDTIPKKILTLLKTSVPDCFLAEPAAEAGTSHGIVFKKNGVWFFEYYKDGTLVSQQLAIKF